MNQDAQPVLYAIVTGSPASRDVGTLVDLAQTDGWDGWQSSIEYRGAPSKTEGRHLST